MYDFSVHCCTLREYWEVLQVRLTPHHCLGNANYLFRSGVAWQFHFREVTVLGTSLYAYTWLVPLVLWTALWWRGNQTRYSLLELLCIYGYSVGVFIPVMVRLLSVPSSLHLTHSPPLLPPPLPPPPPLPQLLWIVNIDWLQWLLLCVGAVVSGASLVLAVWTPLKVEKKQVSLHTVVTRTV